MDLPSLPDETMNGVRAALQQLPIARMETVVEFLEEIFRGYKRDSSGRGVFCLVFDELENITEAAQQPDAEDYNKLVRLLRIFFDNAVREYIDNIANRRSPFLLVIFSIVERAALERLGWLRPDTADRCRSIEYDVNLSPETAEFLMKSMLRIYFGAVLDAACKDTNDGRLLDWKRHLQSADKLDDPFYTYPIMQDVHLFFSQRVLVATPERRVIRRFRAYQDGIRALLDNWTGERPIDRRFTISKSEALRSVLAAYAPQGVELRNIIDSKAIDELIGTRFRRLKSGQAYYP